MNLTHIHFIILLLLALKLMPLCQLFAIFSLPLLAGESYSVMFINTVEEIMNIMRHRRSVRVYNADTISEADINKIIEAGVNAPTGDNFKTTRFMVVRERDMLVKLSNSRKAGTGMLKGADTAILVLGDVEKTDLWVEDCSIATAYMHLAADALGLGSCWIQVRARDADDGQELEKYLRKLLGFPENVKPLCILSLGHTDKHPNGHSKDDVDYSRVHIEKW